MKILNIGGRRQLVSAKVMDTKASIRAATSVNM